MEFKTKYQIGQKVFFLENGKIKCGEVFYNCILAMKSETLIYYGVTNAFVGKFEQKLFATKKELRARLKAENMV